MNESNVLRNFLNHPICALVRHAEREPIPEGSVGLNAQLTEAGIAAAKQLGMMWKPALRSIWSSPVGRCLGTGKAILEGAEMVAEVSEDRMLGLPGPYVVDGNLAWENWVSLGAGEVSRHMMENDDALPGMECPAKGVGNLLDFLRRKAIGPGLHVFITHDNILAVTLARLTGIVSPYGSEAWPRYLEPLYFYGEHDFEYCYWRGQSYLMRSR